MDLKVDYEDQRWFDLSLDAACKELVGWHRHLGPIRAGESNSSLLDVTVTTDTKVWWQSFFRFRIIRDLFS